MHKSNLFYRYSITAMVILLSACANSGYDVDEQFTDINAEPLIQEEAQQLNTPQKKQKTSTKSTINTYSLPASSEVFSLLERDKYHVAKLYKDSTRFVTISEIMKEQAENTIKAPVADTKEEPVIKETTDSKLSDSKAEQTAQP